MRAHVPHRGPTLCLVRGKGDGQAPAAPRAPASAAAADLADGANGHSAGVAPLLEYEMSENDTPKEIGPIEVVGEKPTLEEMLDLARHMFDDMPAKTPVITIEDANGFIQFARDEASSYGAEYWTGFRDALLQQERLTNLRRAPGA